MVARSLLALASAALAAAQSLIIDADTSAPLNKVAAPYIGFNIDTGSIYNGFTFNNSKLINFAKQLGPTICRIGGTAADYSYYIPGSTNPNGGNGHTIVSDAILDDVMTFIQGSGNTLLWDFNGLSFRGANGGAWDPTGNATATLSYLQSKYPGAQIAWSLGNEPGAWANHVTPQQLAKDAYTLKQLLPGYGLGTDVYGSSFMTLSTSDASGYLQQVASMGNFLTGLTMHNYPMARHCNIPDYLNKQYVTGQLGGGLAAVTSVAKAAGAKTLLVLEETAGSYGGGCENITDRFASGFEWLPTLSTVARNGWHRVHRQDLAGWSFTGGMSHYQLVGYPGWVNGDAGLTPHPDWFTTVLFKQLIGDVILNTTATGAANTTSNFDVHVWCPTATAAPSGSGVVLVWTNYGGSDVTLVPEIAGVQTAPRVEFTLTSTAAGYHEAHARVAAGAPLTASDPPASLGDDAIYLNGELLSTDDSTGLLPVYPIPGKVVTDPSAALVAPAYSYGFFVLTGSAPACSS